MTPQERAVIVEVLCSQARADHLGDIRNIEDKLWRLLGVDQPVDDHDSAWRNTKATPLPASLPAYLAGSEDEDDEE